MENKTRERITLFGCTTGIVLSLFTITSKLGLLFETLPFNIQPDATSEVLNILVLLFFFFCLRPYRQELKRPYRPGNRELVFNNERVNKLIEQLCSSFLGFISLLIVFFTLNLFRDLGSPLFTQFNTPFPLLDFLDTVFNVISGAFIYLSFIIICSAGPGTGHQSNNYCRGTVFFLILFVASYLFCLLNFPGSRRELTDLFRLICGLYNGFAMVLLFGRIALIEFHFRDQNIYHSKTSRKLYQYGVTFILPLYVLVQPLYVILAFPQFTGKADILKSLVFIVSFIGKGFLLLFISNAIKNNWLHSYLLLSLVNAKKLQRTTTRTTRRKL